MGKTRSDLQGEGDGSSCVRVCTIVERGKARSDKLAVDQHTRTGVSRSGLCAKLLYFAHVTFFKSFQ